MEEPEHPATFPLSEGSGDDRAHTGSPEAYSPLLAPDAVDDTLHSARAGFWLRLVAFAIDTVILGCFSLGLLSVGLIITSLNDYAVGLGADTEEFSLLVPLWSAGMLMAAAAYFTILHSEYGQTIGKSLLGLEVRMRDGALPSYSQALFRWLAYGVSVAFCGLGFLWVGLNPGKRGWHDLLANTIVVTLGPQES